MTDTRKILFFTILLLLCVRVASAQSKQHAPDSDVTNRSIKAVGYQVGGDATIVVFVGTTAAANASGEAKVHAKSTGTYIELKFQGLPQPTTLGAEFLTYVLWTITPDGSTTNEGEILIDRNGQGKLYATAQPATFAMIVTAEPYSLVSLPSEVVVLENDTTSNTKGRIYPDNSYKLMKRSQYAKLENPLSLTLDLQNVPLDVYEARNAVGIAKAQHADKYAPELFSKATASLQETESSLALGDQRKGKVITNARQTIVFAEDARALSAERQEAERIQQERQAAANEAAANAKAQAAQEAAQKVATFRAQLLKQLNAVLQTTDSPRGLVVNMADVLFDVGKYNLKPDAQIKLARLAGIIQNYPRLHLAIEGHTDDTGSDESNVKLSQQRADAVRDFLMTQGLSADAVSSIGKGKADPVADNATSEGRRKNRRVEIIVSGEVIGAKVG